MKTSSQYINFVQVKGKPKTSVWNCYNIRSGVIIGVVKWYATWRRYCYFPTTETVYSAGCLDDISRFIGELMEQRKQQRLAAEQETAGELKG